MLCLRSFLAAGLVLAASGLQAQTDVWIGGFPDYNASNGNNWVGGLPAGLDAGTDTLEMDGASSVNLTFDTAANFAGLSLAGNGDEVSNFYLTGSAGLTLGSGGITLIEGEYGDPSLTLNTPLVLSANQTWTGGSITDNSTLAGSATLTLGGGGYVYFFDATSAAFTGNVEVQPSATLVAGTNGIFGTTGSLTLDDGSTLSVYPGAAVTLNNSLQIGNGTTGLAVTLANYEPGDFAYQASALTLGGNAALVPTDGYSQVTIANNMTVTFAGTVASSQAGTTLSFNDAESGPGPAMAVFQGPITNVQTISAGGTMSVIFDGAGPGQIAGIALTTNSGDGSNLSAFAGSYFGFGKNYVGTINAVLTSSSISPGNYQGTLGLDTTSGATANFTDSIDLTNFTSSNFIGLGSATKAILSGTIIPVGGLDAPEGTSYQFGGGGGTLQVTSLLQNSTGEGNPMNSLILAPGNAPLTLILSGSLTYTGDTYVNGGALIFDNPVSTGEIFLGESSEVFGYVGATANASTDADPQAFINHLNLSSAGVVGFDSLTGARTVTGPIDFTDFSSLYLGSATTTTYTGAITPDSSDNTYKFAGVKGGTVIIASALGGGTSAVDVGLPTALESNGSYSTVILANPANGYDGGTVLYTGMLGVAGAGSLGTGSLTIDGPSGGGANDFIGLEPYGADVTLANSINLPESPVHLNYPGSPYTLTLTGGLSTGENPADLYVDGPVAITGNNYFSGYVTVTNTTLALNGDEPIGQANLSAYGSTISVTGSEPSVQNVYLSGSTLSFLSDAASIEINGLLMQAASSLVLPNDSYTTLYFMSSDLPDDHNTISIGSNATLDFNFDDDPEIFATISGAGAVELSGGTLILSGTNTYSGGTTIDSYSTLMAGNSSALGTGAVTIYGTLVTNTGATLANPLSLQDGGTIAGYGGFSHGDNLVIQNGSTVAPGLAGLYFSNTALPPAGLLTFGNGASVTFGPGGNYNFALSDANGAAGVGYSSMNISGILDVTATAESPFTIFVYSYAPNNNTPASASVPNFSASNGYSWVLANAAGGIQSFSAADFSLVSSGYFLNSTGTGGFYITQSGNELLLNFSPVPEPATVALLAAGAGAVGLWAWRRRRARA